MFGSFAVPLVACFLAACSRTSLSDSNVRNRDARVGWVEVLAEQDPDNAGSEVRISIDTLGTRQVEGGAYFVWLETTHSKERMENGHPGNG